MIFPLAEILRLEKFRQAHNLRSAPSGVGNTAQGLLEILFRLRTARHLHQRHAKFLRGHASLPPRTNIAGQERAISYLLQTSLQEDGFWCSAKTRVSRTLPATSCFRCSITSCEGMERRIASIAPSASSDSVRTSSSRNSSASSWRVSETAESKTERHHGSSALSKDARNASKAAAE